MAPDDHSGARPAGPVVLRIKLRYDDLDAMVQKFASNVGKSGLFLPTKSIQPVGTEVKFELRLANDTPVLVGLGRVKHVRAPDPANPRASFGMAIELMRVSREGREVIIRMIERRRAIGLPDVAIPIPDDAEVARRNEAEAQPRTDTNAVMREAMAQLASASRRSEQMRAAAPPASEPTDAEDETTGVVPKQDPSDAVASPASSAAVAKHDSIRAEHDASGAIVKHDASSAIAGPKERPSAPLLTAPRSSTGAVSVVPLAPEKPRRRRPRVEELVDKAAELSAPVVAALTVPELDMHVDLDHVLTRARTLAGGELDGELEALREAAAAPVEISIEAASAELARQLGGKPIAKRDRSGSARWVPPPPVAELRARTPAEDTRAQAPAVETTAPERAQDPEPAQAAPAREPAPDFSTKMRAETELAPSASIAEAVAAAVDAASPISAATSSSAASSSASSVTPSATASSTAAATPSIVPQATYAVRPRTPTYEDADDGAASATDSTTNVGAEPTGIRTSDDDDAFAANAGTTSDDDDAFAASAGTTTDVLGAIADSNEPETGAFDSVAPDAPARALMIEDDADLSSFERALDAARVHTGLSTQPVPLDDDAADAAEDLLESGEYHLADDVEMPGERTQTGGVRVSDYAQIPDQLAVQLDQQLAEVEAEAERELADDFTAAPGAIASERGPADEDAEEEVSDLDVLAEADEDEADLLGDGDPASDGYAYGAAPVVQAYAAAPVAQPAYPPEPVDDFASRLALDDDDPPQSDAIDRRAAREFDHVDQRPTRELDEIAERELDDIDRLLGRDLGGIDSIARHDLDDIDRLAGRDLDEIDRLAGRDLDDFDHEAAREFDEGVPVQRHAAPRYPARHPSSELHEPSLEPREPIVAAPPADVGRVPRYRRASSEHSASYTVAEDLPQAALQLPDDAVDALDEPHGYAPSASQRLIGPDPRLLRHGRATTAAPNEDLEDALAALDVDLDELANLEARRPRRHTPSASLGPRPLPGLPVERQVSNPPTGPVPLANAPVKAPTGQVPIARPPTSPPASRGAPKPPPIPAAARRSPTRQVPVVQAPKRATTDEGVLIDFEDDE